MIKAKIAYKMQVYKMFNKMINNLVKILKIMELYVKYPINYPNNLLKLILTNLIYKSNLIKIIIMVLSIINLYKLNHSISKIIV